MRIQAIVAAVILVTSAPAMAQVSDEQFKREVLERLARIEQRLNTGSGGGGRTVTAATSIPCGTNCAYDAEQYCKRAGYRTGVPATLEGSSYNTVMRQVTCTD